MLPLCTQTPLPTGPLPVTFWWGECAPIQHKVPVIVVNELSY